MSKQKKQKKKQPLNLCKHCNTPLKQSDIRKLSKKSLPERHGLMWGGIEYPYIQIYRVHCPNLACGKEYSCKEELSTWKYK